ncbi:MAG: relaxase/mobilization nuclease domain-containing protein [Alistipes sp.]|nr:relaxase/mobilization nuclease domain-containing protein [Alistipes sp.]
MIAKNKKGKSFGGCVRYVLNEDCEILEAEGVMACDEASIIRDFAIQRSGRPEIKQPVGHIPISFSAEDSPRLTNDFMVQLAKEYMQEMGICNTQYIVVRHNDTAHPHMHIVYNRIDNDLKVISVNNDYKRNIKACKKLKDRYGLTYGKTGKEKVNRPKLHGPDKLKYEIHDTLKAILPKCRTFDDLEKRLKQGGISIKYKYRSGAVESEENIQGVSFEKGGCSFKGSEIDKKFSYGNLKKTLSAKLNEAWEKIKDMIMPEGVKQPEPIPLTPKPNARHQSRMPATEVKKQPEPTASDHMSWRVAMGLTDNPARKQSAAPQLSTEVTSPKPVERLTEAVRQESKPAPPINRNPSIGGVEVTDNQVKILREGGHIYLENMEKKGGSGKISTYVFLDDSGEKVFWSEDNPDSLVKYGDITIRLRDKIQVEKGYIVKAKMKWWGGIDYQYPFVWKDPKTNEVKYDFADPRIPKEVHDREMKEFREENTGEYPVNQSKKR